VGSRRDDKGSHSVSRLEDGPVRVIVTEQHPGATSEPTLRDHGEALVAVYGTDNECKHESSMAWRGVIG
jgi:3-(3-hydroxy-phenyl)propionate hydroxylase